MDNFTIALEPEEQRLLEGLEFDVHRLDYDTFQLNATRARDLAKALAARGGIPEHRRRYFIDPEYHPGGRKKSRQQMFERNGCRGEDILMHAHFLPHLRYFIYGPDLPESVMTRFTEGVKDCGMVTSSDIVPLGTFARKLARDSGLEKYEASEEFFKLALELGLRAYVADSIRRAVLQLRS
jgi:hypothetical protein